jgi:hypothetical protein
MRLRRLCFEIFAFRRFLREPMSNYRSRLIQSHPSRGFNHFFIATRGILEIGLVGFEPTASWSRTRRSTKLSHSPKVAVDEDTDVLTVHKAQGCAY